MSGQTILGITLDLVDGRLGFDGPFKAELHEDHLLDPKRHDHMIYLPAWTAEVSVCVQSGRGRGNEVSVSHTARTKAAAVRGLRRKVRHAVKGFAILGERLKRGARAALHDSGDPS